MLEWRSESSEIFVLSRRFFFLRLSLLWGFGENVLYLDNYTIFFEIFVSKIIYFIHRIVVIVLSV